MLLGKSEQLRESRNVRRQIATHHLRNGASPQSTTNDAVVVEHGHTVVREPHIGLQTRRTQPYGQQEGRHRVFFFVCSRSAMRKQHRWLQNRRESLLHGATLRRAT